MFVSDGKLHDVNILDQLEPEPGAFYVMDRGYIDFERLARFHQAGSFFVTRAKSNFKAERRYSRPVDRTTGLICNQTLVLTVFYFRKGFEAPLRRIRFRDPESGKRLVFLTTNLALPALTITKLYRLRWRVELFFDGPPFCTPSYAIECQGRADCCRWCAGFFCRRRPRSICRRRPCAQSKARSRTHGWPAAASSGSFGAP